MLANTSVAFVGSGAMAEAMIAGLLNQQLVAPQDIRASGPRAERGEYLQRKYDVRTTTDNRLAAQEANVVVLSVKPKRWRACSTN